MTREGAGGRRNWTVLGLLAMGSTPSKSLSPPSVVVCGSTNVDMIASDGPRFPKKSETIAFEHFEQCFGGKGANQAVQAAKFVRTEMIAKVGSDSLGKQMVDNFQEMAVGQSGVTKADGASGCALITVAEDTNTIVIVPGANGKLNPTDVQKCSTILDEAKVLLTQLEIPTETTLAALQKAKGLKILNTAPIPANGVDPELLRAADVVCANEVELSLLTGLPCSSVDEAAVAAHKLLVDVFQQGTNEKVVLATLGGMGSLVVSSASLDRDELKDENDGWQAIHVPAEPNVKVVDTTGAGDSFLGALAAFIAAGLPFLAAVRDATKVAALAIQRPSTQPSYPSIDDLVLQYPDAFARGEDGSFDHTLPGVSLPSSSDILLPRVSVSSSVVTLLPDGTFAPFSSVAVAAAS